MKKKTAVKRVLQQITMPLLAFMLVLSTILPAGVVKADVLPSSIEIGMKVFDIPATSVETLPTEKKVKEGKLQFKLTLPSGKEWATDINGKKDLIKNAFGDIKILDISTEVTDFSKPLFVTVDENPDYKIDNNKVYKINLSPALIENWQGTVTPIEFTVYATASLSLGGSITKETTLQDIQKGGKVIELSLVNATWNKEKLYTITEYNKLLDSFEVGSSSGIVWEVATKLKQFDPNTVLSYSDDKRILYLKLPALPALPSASTTGDISFAITNPSNFYTIDVVGDFKKPDGLSQIDGVEIESNTFSIGAQGKPELTATPYLHESALRDTEQILTLTLTNAEWSGFTTEKKLQLIESLQPKNQKDQWELIKSELVANPDLAVSRTSDTVVTIKIPKVPNLHLITKELIVSAKIPYQLLEEAVTIPEQTFTIVAQPKVLLSVPSLTQIDFAKGGKVITLTLVNAKWQNDVATKTIKRESLLNAFDWGTTKEEVLAKADVKRTNEHTVTIKLPSISTKFSGDIKFDSKKLVDSIAGGVTPGLLESSVDFLEKVDFKAIVVTPAVSQPPTITGTATNKINDLDIVQGGKTVVITLKNDTWTSVVKDGYSGFTLTEANGQMNYTNYTVKRMNDTTVELTLDAINYFNLTSDSKVSITIPEAALSVNNQELKVDSAFTIAAVTATLTGTGVSMDPVDVQKGGKTLIITLNNAEFKDGLTAEDVKEMFVPTSIPIPWGLQKENITVSKNKLTIKLPAVSNYQSNSSRALNLSVKGAHLKGYESIAVTKNVIDGTVTIGGAVGGAVGATIGTSSFTEADIQKGDKSISITLTNADWDKTIETNSSGKSALVKGFAVTDQKKEWGLVTSKIVSSGVFIVNGNVLTITLPPVIDYSIIRDQEVFITIPKSVLSNYKYDIKVEQPLTVKTPDIQSDSTFAEVLESGLVEYIDQNGLENIRVEVPKKIIQTISTYVTELNGKTIATIEVNTNDSAKKVTATLLTENEETSKTIEDAVNNQFIFVFDDLALNSTLRISVQDDSDELLEESYKKLAKGNKTYIEVPKTPLEGKYSLYSLLTDKKLLTNILKYYAVDDFKIGLTK